jgi:phage terminase small subunit
MTEMTFDQAEALGYDGTQRTDNIAPSLETQVEIMSQRIAELQRLNEEKVRTIAEKDDRIVGLVNEVERAHESESIEVQRSSEARAEVEAMKRQAVELANGRDMYKRMYNEVRDDIATWADEHDLDREFVNGLLETLNMDLLPEYVEADIEIRVTVRFEAGAGTPNQPSSEWLKEQIEVGAVEVRPAWSSSLKVEEISTDYHDVNSVVAH